MALNNIISPRQSVVNSQGQPVAGGSVFLYEPGTTTFITSYFSSDLITPHQNPVRLSGSGRADIWVTLNCDMVITDRNGNTVLTQDSVNPDSLGGETTSLVPNGSFETVTTPPVPDGWSAVDDAGSTNAVDSTQSTDGANSYRFTSAGSGGGSLTTTDFFPVNAVDQLRVNFDMFSDVAAVRNIVRVEWYDVTFVSISDTDVYDSTANPATWTEFQLVATPPALARFAKLKLIGIDPSVLLAGNTYFDRISVFYPTVVSGIFDNITIQNNEIITTNLNGELNLLPNGLGPVNVFSSGTVDLADIQNSLNIGNVFGPTANPHIAMDAATIQAKADATNAALALSLQPLGGIVSLGAAGVTRAATAPGGILGILSDGNTDAEGRLLVLTHQDGTARAQLGHAGVADLDLVNLIDTGVVNIAATNTGSALRVLLSGDPDGIVQGYHPATDLVAWESRDPAAGGLFVNNTLTGAGLERVLTTPGDAAALLPTGTVTNSTLRWNGSAWVESTVVRIEIGGELQTNEIRALGANVIDILGMTETDIGMRFRDGAPIGWNDTTESNYIQFSNIGIGGTTGGMQFSSTQPYYISLLGGNFRLYDSGGLNNATISMVGTQSTLAGFNNTLFSCVPPIKLTQQASHVAGQAVSGILYVFDAVVDADIQPYMVMGAAGTERALAFVNTKQRTNTNQDMEGSAQRAQEMVNGTLLYDDGASYTVTLEPNTQERFPIGGTFTILVPGSNVITVAVGATGNLFFIDPGTGTSDVGASCTIGTGGTSGYATIYRETANDWFILGAGITA